MTLKVAGSTQYATLAGMSDVTMMAGGAADIISFDETTGAVTFSAEPPSDNDAAVLLYWLCGQSDTEFEIIPSSPEDMIPDTWNLLGANGTIPVCARGLGFEPTFAVLPDQSLRVTLVQVWYDANDYQEGSGYFGYTANLDETPVPTYQLLAFALACAAMSAQTAPKSPAAPWGVPAEQQPLALENDLRTSMGLPQRAFVHNVYVSSCSVQPGKRADAGTGAPPKPASQSGDGWVHHVDCFVATAAYGSAIAPEVDTLRRFRDQVARATRWGSNFFARFYARYYEVSPAIADKMRQDSQFCELMRLGIVEPYVRYLELALDFPDAPLDDVPEPWRHYLQNVSRNLDSWAERLGMPADVSGLPPEEAAREIGITLRHGIHDKPRRATFISEQQRLGLLPIILDQAAATRVRVALAAAGLALDAIEAIVATGDRHGAPR